MLAGSWSTSVPVRTMLSGHVRARARRMAGRPTPWPRWATGISLKTSLEQAMLGSLTDRMMTPSAFSSAAVRAMLSSLQAHWPGGGSAPGLMSTSTLRLPGGESLKTLRASRSADSLLAPAQVGRLPVRSYMARMRSARFCVSFCSILPPVT